MRKRTEHTITLNTTLPYIYADIYLLISPHVIITITYNVYKIGICACKFDLLMIFFYLSLLYCRIILVITKTPRAASHLQCLVDNRDTIYPFTSQLGIERLTPTKLLHEEQNANIHNHFNTKNIINKL